jgi:hypothetical protein
MLDGEIKIILQGVVKLDPCPRGGREETPRNPGV